MRMVHYFGGFAALVIPALLWTAWTGFAGGGERHVSVGLLAAVFAVLAHTLVILFMLVTGRVLKEAMATRPFPQGFLVELNEFFARKKAYPAALLGASATAAAAVLGYAHRGFGIPAWVHSAAGCAAIGVNIWAIVHEVRALQENRGLIDRAALELDRIDQEARAHRKIAGEVCGELAIDEERPEPYDPARVGRWGIIVALSAWFPYLYWALIVWRGEFGRVSVHPWIEGSALGFAIWWIARREARAAA
jgi:hypothetical protein